MYHLSEIYHVSYENLMAKAGYLAHGKNKKDHDKHGSAATFSVDNLTPDEEEVLLEYLTFIRKRKKD